MKVDATNISPEDVVADYEFQAINPMDIYLDPRIDKDTIVFKGNGVFRIGSQQNYTSIIRGGIDISGKKDVSGLKNLLEVTK